MQKKLELKNLSVVRVNLWTDIQVVLGYINNEYKLFKVFVTNRVQLIFDNSNTNQCH